MHERTAPSGEQPAASDARLKSCSKEQVVECQPGSPVCRPVVSVDIKHGVEAPANAGRVNADALGVTAGETAEQYCDGSGNLGVHSFKDANGTPIGIGSIECPGCANCRKPAPEAKPVADHGGRQRAEEEWSLYEKMYPAKPPHLLALTPHDKAIFIGAYALAWDRCHTEQQSTPEAVTKEDKSWKAELQGIRARVHDFDWTQVKRDLSRLLEKLDERVDAESRLQAALAKAEAERDEARQQIGLVWEERNAALRRAEAAEAARTPEVERQARCWRAAVAFRSIVTLVPSGPCATVAIDPETSHTCYGGSLEAAILAAADAVLGEGWDKQEAQK